MLLALQPDPGLPARRRADHPRYRLWFDGDRLQATRIAAALGRGFAFALIALGIVWMLTGYLLGGLWTAFIGFFAQSGGERRGAADRARARLEGLRVSDVMDDEPVALPADLPLDRAENEFFLRYGWEGSWSWMRRAGWWAC